MIVKYHNHKLQTTPWHREEEPLNDHETPGRQIKQSNPTATLSFKNSLSSSIFFPIFDFFSIQTMFSLIPSDLNDPQGLMRR